MIEAVLRLVALRTLCACMISMGGFMNQAYACACCETYRVVGVASNDVLNIRSRASARSYKVGFIPPDSCGVLISGPDRGSWVQIEYNGTTGWVNSRYLEWVP